MKKPSQSFLQSLSAEINTLQKQVKTLNLLFDKTENFKVQVETYKMERVLNKCQNNLSKIQNELEAQVERIEKIANGIKCVMLINLVLLIIWTISSYLLFL